MSAAYCGRVVTLGVHIVDILGRPVTRIPPGQGRLLLDEIRVTAAGTAAGTSVDLAKLGAQAVGMGAIGDDVLADLLTTLLDGYGVDTRRLARKAGLRTSATILPIRPNGERPALHMPGATSALELSDIDLPAIAAADVLHVGGPDVLGRFGGEPLREVLEFARGRGVITTMDLLAPGDAPTWDRFIIGLLRGWPIEEAAWLAMAAASQVAGGLGSDAGIVDYASTLAYLDQHAPDAIRRRIQAERA